MACRFLPVVLMVVGCAGTPQPRLCPEPPEGRLSCEGANTSTAMPTYVVHASGAGFHLSIPLAQRAACSVSDPELSIAPEHHYPGSRSHPGYRVEAAAGTPAGWSAVLFELDHGAKVLYRIHMADPPVFRCAADECFTVRLGEQTMVPDHGARRYDTSGESGEFRVTSHGFNFASRTLGLSTLELFLPDGTRRTADVWVGETSEAIPHPAAFVPECDDDTPCAEGPCTHGLCSEFVSVDCGCPVPCD